MRLLGSCSIGPRPRQPETALRGSGKAFDARRKTAGPSLFALFPVLALGLFFVTATCASGALYVTDQLEITLRAGAGLDYKIVRMLPSGASVEKLEEREGWARVRTSGGDEGWVISRYLTPDSPKGPRLEAALRELESLKGGAGAFKAELETVRAEKDRSSAEAARLQSRLDAVERDFTAWKKTNEGVVALKERADSLAAAEETTRAELDRLRAENRNLRTREIFFWFFSGAAVLFLGWVLGYLYASSRQRGKSRSSYRF